MNKRHGLIIAGSMVVTVMAGSIFMLKRVEGPAQGTIVTIPQGKATRATKKPVGQPGIFRGTYISFTYPTGYQQISTQKSSNYLDVAGYISSDASSKHMAVAVVKENVANDSGMNYRKQHTDIYHEVRDVQGTVIFYSTVNGTERTAYVMHDGMVATIAITSPFQVDLISDLQSVLASLVWR